MSGPQYRFEDMMKKNPYILRAQYAFCLPSKIAQIEEGPDDFAVLSRRPAKPTPSGDDRARQCKEQFEKYARTYSYPCEIESQWELLEQQKITRDQVQVRRFTILFQELGVSCNAREISDIYKGYLSQGHYFLPGAEELLEALSKDYRLYLVSNGMHPCRSTDWKAPESAIILTESLFLRGLDLTSILRNFLTAAFGRWDNVSKEK